MIKQKNQMERYLWTQKGLKHLEAALGEIFEQEEKRINERPFAVSSPGALEWKKWELRSGLSHRSSLAVGESGLYTDFT